MRHASLFSGIGGFDLAAQRMGWENVMQCEIDPFCQKVLKYHFPSAKLYGDIRDIDGKEWRGKIDVLTGGFPCQPFSAAGRRTGTEDNRFLWPAMFNFIQDAKPSWIIAENVNGIVTIENGMVFERVCSEMEAIGYDVQPFCIPACGVGAAHRRNRIWFIAHYEGEGRQQMAEQRKQNQKDVDASGETVTASDTGRERWYEGSGEGVRSAGEKPKHEDGDDTDSHPDADTTGKGLEIGKKSGQQQGEFRSERHSSPSDNAQREGLEGHARHGNDEERRKEQNRSSSAPDWSQSWVEAATRLCGVDDGVSGKLDGITFPRWRKESLKAYGNAIVPEVAYQIFQSIPQ